MSELWACKECGGIYHDRSNKFLVWFDIAGGCRCAQSWRESHMDDDYQQFLIDLAWLDLTYKLDIFDNQPMYTVTHDCSCVTQEISPVPRNACYQCLSQRTEDRY